MHYSAGWKISLRAQFAGLFCLSDFDLKLEMGREGTKHRKEGRNILPWFYLQAKPIIIQGEGIHLAFSLEKSGYPPGKRGRG